MKKTYTNRENHIVLNPNTGYEEDITEAGTECTFCKYCYLNTCKHYNKSIPKSKQQCYCDYFTMINDYEEVEE